MSASERKEKLELLKKEGVIDKNEQLNENVFAILPCVEEPSDDNEVSRVIGVDTRTLVSSGDRDQLPYSAVVRLLMYYGPGLLYRGTGFIVGRNKLVTAGHCVYSAARGSVPIDIFAFLVLGTRTYIGVATGVRFDNSRLSVQSGDNDWAVIKFDTDLGSLGGILNIVDCDSLTYGTYNGEIPGYPGYVQQLRSAAMWTAKGTVSLTSANLLDYTISTSHGDSGAPVMIQRGGTWSAIGIHILGGPRLNRARKIDGVLRDEIVNF